MKWLVSVACLMLAFSGCLEGQIGDDNEGDGNAPFDSGNPTGQPPSGTAATHGDPVIEVGPEETHPPEGNRPWWEVRQDITVDNDFGGANNGDLALSLDAGAIVVGPSPDGDYHYTLQIIGGGGTQAEAQEAFDRIEWDHTDSLQAGTLALQTHVTSSVNVGGSCSGIPPLTTCTGQYARAFITALVPGAPSHDIDVQTSSGDFEVSGLRGNQLVGKSSSGDGSVTEVDFTAIELEASSGDLSLSALRAGAASIVTSSGDCTIDDATILDISLEVSSGDCDVEVTLHDLAFEGSSGSLDAILVPTATGTITGVASSGDIDIQFEQVAPAAFDVTGRASSGDIDIDIPDSETLADGDEHVHKRSMNFASAAIQTTVDLETSSGDVTVQA